MKNSQIFWNVLAVIVQIAIAYYINIGLVLALQLIHFILICDEDDDIFEYFKYSNIIVYLLCDFDILSFFSFLIKKIINIIDSINIKS